MGQWSVSPSDDGAIIDGGRAYFPPNKGEESKTYIITYTNDNGNEMTATVTVDGGCQCDCNVDISERNFPSERQNNVEIGTFSSDNCDGEWEASFKSGSDFLSNFTFDNGGITVDVSENDSSEERSSVYVFSIGDCEKEVTFTQNSGCSLETYYILIDENIKLRREGEEYTDGTTYFLTPQYIVSINQQTGTQATSHSVQELINYVGTKTVSCECKVIDGGWEYGCSYNIPDKTSISDWTNEECKLGGRYNLFKMETTKTDLNEITYTYTKVGLLVLRDKNSSDDECKDTYLGITKTD